VAAPGGVGIHLPATVNADSSLKYPEQNANCEIMRQSNLNSLGQIQSSQIVCNEVDPIEGPCQDVTFVVLPTWPFTIGVANQINQVISGPSPDTLHLSIPDNLCLSIVNMNGDELAVLLCRPEDAVSRVKRRLSHTTCTPGQEQHLVYGNRVLKDCETLRASGITQAHATLQCINVRPSGVARNLAAQRCSRDPDTALSASLADVVDSVMQTEHALSESVRPSAADVATAITPHFRGELINWMVKAFDAMSFDDSMLHSIVLTFDRYCGRSPPIEVTAIQTVLMAVVCTEMKLVDPHYLYAGAGGGWREVIAHLCQRRLSRAAILKRECDVLQKLGFVVGVPTPVTFLREFALRVEEAGGDGDLASQLALFLLELALFEPEIQYAHPHVILAAGALSAALRALDAPPTQREALVDDLSIYGADLRSMEDAVLDCEESLLNHWLMCSTGNTMWGHFYVHLENKFNRDSRHNVSQLSPSVSLERFLQTRLPEASG